jgi:hypothetical protein
MAASTRARANWAIGRATALPEVWALVAKHSGLVGAWRLMRVCKAASVGAKEWLGTLPGLVVCGGSTASSTGLPSRYIWRLDLATLLWEPLPDLLTARYDHACCAVRGTLVVLGGRLQNGSGAHSVEMFSSGQGAFGDLPPLSCGGIFGSAAIAVEESDSAAGQVLLPGGDYMQDVQDYTHSSVHLVDLATGVCTPQPGLLAGHVRFASVRLVDVRIVCAGGADHGMATSSVELYEPEDASDGPWTWRELPAMAAARRDCRGCVTSDGRFVVLGGGDGGYESRTSCEAITVGDDDEQCEPLSSMNDPRSQFACAAVAGCIIVAGGFGAPGGSYAHKTAEFYDEVLNRWFRLPSNLPHYCFLVHMGSALL